MESRTERMGADGKPARAGAKGSTAALGRRRPRGSSSVLHATHARSPVNVVSHGGGTYV
jgi:hypothetical protein